MEVKYQLKTKKIKGLSFHPIRHWLLTSNYSGEVKIVDYMVGTVLQEYTVSEKQCIRSVDFHPTQPIFVCGGHDKNVYVYDYNQRRRTTVFEGHDDYVRSVVFHPTHPFVLSASDDQTMRIWNWQSKKHLVLLTGHKYYVMCAKFHPTKNLIVSASLDMSIRLWNFSRLIEKVTSGNGIINQLDVELVATVENSHEKGLNWISFHPSEDLIMSASDDKRVKLWTFTKDEIKIKESFYGHTYNVCCVEYSEPTGVVLSNSEDFTLKAWDLSGSCLDTYTKSGEKQWLVASHPKLPYCAIGTDNSLVVLSLRDMRTSFTTFNNSVYYVDKFNLRERNVATGVDRIISDDLHKTHLSNQELLEGGKAQSIEHNSFNKSKVQLVIRFDETKLRDDRLLFLEFDTKTMEVSKQILNNQKAVFLGKNKLAALNNGRIELSDLETQMTIGQVQDVANVDDIFQGNIGKIIFREHRIVYYYDTVAKRVINSISEFVLRKLRKVVWNKKMTCCALITNQFIFLMNKNFVRTGRVYEGTNIVEAFWSKDDVLVYSTLNHLKYVLSNGDKGIIKSLNNIIYPAALSNSELIHFTSNGTINQFSINCDEFVFKRHIQKTDIKKVKAFVNSKTTPGNALIAYLQQKNYPFVALSLASDEKTKFQLALKAGNLRKAYEAAEVLESKECYSTLANEALNQGCIPLVELGYQESENFQKLSFLHLLNGNLDGLEEVETHAAEHDDKLSQFNISLYKGDIKKRIKLLSETGQLALAFQMAKVHGLEDYAEAIRKGIPTVASKIKWSKKSTALLPPKPLISDYEEASEMISSWPVYDVSEEKAAFANFGSDDEDEAEIGDAEDIEDGQEDEEEDQVDEGALFNEAKTKWGGSGNNAFGGGDLDDDFSDDDISDDQNSQTGEGDNQAQNSGQGGFFVAREDPLLAYVKKESVIPSDLVAIGEFKKATERLQTQIGLKDKSQVMKCFADIYMASQFYESSFDFVRPRAHFIASKTNKNLPYPTNNLKLLEAKLQQAYDLTTKAMFPQAVQVFREVILRVPLLSLTTKAEEKVAREMLAISSEYIFGLTCDSEKKQTVSSTSIIFKILNSLTSIRLILKDYSN